MRPGTGQRQSGLPGGRDLPRAVLPVAAASGALWGWRACIRAASTHAPADRWHWVRKPSGCCWAWPWAPRP